VGGNSKGRNTSGRHVYHLKTKYFLQPCIKKAFSPATTWGGKYKKYLSEIMDKTPFSSATTWKQKYFLKLLIKNAFSPATTWKVDLIFEKFFKELLPKTLFSSATT